MFQQIGKCGWHLVCPATFDKRVQTLRLSKKKKKKFRLCKYCTRWYSDVLTRQSFTFCWTLDGFILGNLVLLGTPYKKILEKKKGTPYKIEYRCTTYKNSRLQLLLISNLSRSTHARHNYKHFVPLINMKNLLLSTTVMV